MRVHPTVIRNGTVIIICLVMCISAGLKTFSQKRLTADEIPIDKCDIYFDEPQSNIKKVNAVQEGELKRRSLEANALYESELERQERLVSELQSRMQMDEYITELKDEYALRAAEVERERQAALDDETNQRLSQASIGATVELETYVQLLNKMYDFLGVAYVWGGNSMSGTDCSGFAQQVYRSVGIELPRVAVQQSQVGRIVDRHNLVLGDILFFDTRNARDYNDIVTPTEEMQNAVEIELGLKPNIVSHVGIYIGNGKMIHASSGDGYITFANLNSKYYMTRFLFARRILGEV